MPPQVQHYHMRKKDGAVASTHSWSRLPVAEREIWGLLWIERKYKRTELSQLGESAKKFRGWACREHTQTRRCELECLRETYWERAIIVLINLLDGDEVFGRSQCDVPEDLS